MLQTDSASEHSSVDATENNATKANLSNRMNGESRNGVAKSFTEEDASSSSNPVEWEEVKKARNRINSQRTRERERAQIKNLEAERARLWLSNDAIKFQNRHFRELIAQIIEIRDLKRMRAGGSSNSSSTLFGAGALGAGMPVSMRQDMMGGLGGGLDGELSTRLSAAAKNLSGFSDADLLARRQANALEMQNMMRHQEAMDRFGAGGGMGGLNMGLGSRMAGGAAGGAPGPSARGMNMNGMNINTPYSDMAENIRIRKLMLQHSAAGGDGVGSGFGVNGVDDSMNGNGNSNGLSLGAAVGGIGGFGELNGMSDAEILHMSKRQKFGY